MADASSSPVWPKPKARRTIAQLQEYEGWKEQPETMLMPPLGVAQVLSLVVSCAVAVWTFYSLVGLKVGTAMLGTTLLLLGPLGIGKCVLLPLQLDLSTVVSLRERERERERERDSQRHPPVAALLLTCMKVDLAHVSLL